MNETKWISVNDYGVALPSPKGNNKIIVTDGQEIFIISVKAFLDSVDSPFNQWTHWMNLPELPNK